MTMTPELSVAPEQPLVAPRKSRKNNPEKTRENILQEAIVEFVQQGLSGAGLNLLHQPGGALRPAAQRGLRRAAMQPVLQHPGAGAVEGGQGAAVDPQRPQGVDLESGQGRIQGR